VELYTPLILSWQLRHDAPDAADLTQDVLDSSAACFRRVRIAPHLVEPRPAFSAF
jgi:hypothetical protein